MLIRNADNNDVMDIYKWRNDPLSLSMSENSSIISIVDHKIWFKNILIDPSKKIYIGIVDENKIGVTKFEIDEYENKAKVSINLNPSMRGKKFSFDLLSKSVAIYLKQQEIKLTAIVKNENLASLKIFKKCGFKKKSEDSTFQYLFYF